jgi:hypothetical protein
MYFYGGAYPKHTHGIIPQSVSQQISINQSAKADFMDGDSPHL